MRTLLSLIRYARYLSLKQVLGRLVHEAKSRTLAASLSQSHLAQTHVRSPEQLRRFADWYGPLGDRFDDASRMYDGVFVSKGVAFDFKSPEAVTWSNPFEDPALAHWEHDLSFFLFLLPLAASDAARALALASVLVERLEATTPLRLGRRPPFANAPIALAIRVLALTAVFGYSAEADPFAVGEDRNRVVQHVRRCRRLLRWTLETHLGFNHLVFGAAALAAAEALLDEVPKSALLAATELDRCLTIDGFWSERSPSYHVHMLFVARALQALPELPTKASLLLASVVARMQEALKAVVHPDGEIAVFNDAAIRDAVSPTLVGWRGPASSVGAEVLTDAGYARLWAPEVVVIFDAGPMGPDEVIGHGHADFLSFEASFYGQRLVADPGVASIVGGESRVWTRSAASHNAPVLGGLEPAEFFGTWRVGRRGTARITDSLVSDAEVTVSGESLGVKPGRVIHRSLCVRPQEIEWVDSIPMSFVGNASCSFFITSAWVVSFDGAVVRMSLQGHPNSSLLFSATGASLVGLSPAHIFPDGPMSPQEATVLRWEYTASASVFKVQPE